MCYNLDILIINFKKTMIDQLTYKLNMKRIKGYKRARAKKEALKTLKTILILIAFLSISLVIMGFDSLADLIIK